MFWSKRPKGLLAAMVLAGACLLPGSLRASEQANLLFIEALEMYQAVEARTGEARLDLLRSIQAILERIARDHPESIPGQKLLSGEVLGPLDPVSIAFELSQAGPSAGSMTQAVDDKVQPLGDELMRARFADNCAQARLTGPDPACPYVEQNSCSGEGCRTTGIVMARQRFSTSRQPGGDASSFTAGAGEYLVNLETRIYTVPCPGTVKSSWEGIAPGTAVHQLSYAGEGTYRFLLDGKIRAQGVEDGIELASGCEPRSEVWRRLRNASGLEGWTEKDFDALRGLDRFGGDDDFIARAPDWARQELTRAETRTASAAFKSRYCRAPGATLSGDEIASTLLGGRMNIELAGRVEGRYYLTRKGPKSARGLIVFSQENLPEVSGEVEVVGDVLCLRRDRAAGNACDRVRRCEDHGADSYILESVTGDFSAHLTGVELAGSELAREIGPPGDYLVNSGMTGWDFERFLPCARDGTRAPFTAECLASQGFPEDVARRYARLGQIMEHDVIIEGVRDLGRYQVLDAFHPNWANSNSQQYLFLEGRPVDFDFDGVDRGLAQPWNAEARRIKRSYPKALIDFGRGRIVYFRLERGAPVLYHSLTILNGCRACEPVGIVSVETRMTNGKPDSRAIAWSVLEPGEWSRPGPEITDLLDFYEDDPKALQGRLGSSGYNPGPVDGVIGARTRRALREFQHEHCIDPVVGLDQKSAEALWRRNELWGGCHAS
ncbi:peptidoglycan-binding domain-containing protein [Aliiruegeria sabulilitoris]|uniref:peptidoglycan-binding domain-containing protein n=1 Tax=Aliiruegeria sabulilitoris TaxID=1510458 RepID=UPI00082C6DDE|nr:peptidoglycan-binding domain-containing protein [Aliiruegeria sabulilitoris]NDR55398.1 peptidoglycan-binding protein [Pseudoruegeria sp. M32A2M]